MCWRSRIGIVNNPGTGYIICVYFSIMITTKIEK
jgi:hypothetical protein